MDTQPQEDIVQLHKIAELDVALARHQKGDWEVMVRGSGPEREYLIHQLWDAVKRKGACAISRTASGFDVSAEVALMDNNNPPPFINEKDINAVIASFAKRITTREELHDFMALSQNKARADKKYQNLQSDERESAPYLQAALQALQDEGINISSVAQDKLREALLDVAKKAREKRAPYTI